MIFQRKSFGGISPAHTPGTVRVEEVKIEPGVMRFCDKVSTRHNVGWVCWLEVNGKPTCNSGERPSIAHAKTETAKLLKEQRLDHENQRIRQIRRILRKSLTK